MSARLTYTWRGRERTAPRWVAYAAAVVIWALLVLPWLAGWVLAALVLL